MSDERTLMVMSICRYIHAMKGWVMGAAVRRIFMGSNEQVNHIDCIFETNEDANFFLRTLRVEHLVFFSNAAKHGMQEYTASRIAQSGQRHEVRICVHAYYSGLTRRARFPRNIPFPAVDIDCVVWYGQGVREAMPAQVKREEFALDNPSSLAMLMERVQSRRFGITNHLVKHSPEAAVRILEYCGHLVRDENFQMDLAYGATLESPIVFRVGVERPVTCSIAQTDLEMGSLAIRLQCGHEFGFEGIINWIQHKVQSQTKEVKCPMCNQSFITPMVIGEGLDMS